MSCTPGLRRRSAQLQKRCRGDEHIKEGGCLSHIMHTLDWNYKLASLFQNHPGLGSCIISQHCCWVLRGRVSPSPDL